MTLTRRRFLRQTTPLLAGHTALVALAPLLGACGGDDAGAEPGTGPDEGDAGPAFRHGVASGDPSANAVILWTRVTPPAADAADAATVAVTFVVARDPELSDVVTEGAFDTNAERDFTVKVDADGLEAGSTYYYRFSALGETSPVGRTRTLPPVGVTRARLAVTSCANHPAGFFNAYRRIAERPDLDLVLHLGDYIYEFANGTLGDGSAIDRMPDPQWEIVSLDDYRRRHAQYKTDADLQEVHRQHPFVVVWDDHEFADDSRRDGAVNHQPESEGDWAERKRAAQRAYFEWMPIRESAATQGGRIYRSLSFGDLFRLVMLDTRLVGRDDHIASNCDSAGIVDPARSLLGAEQESWLEGEAAAFAAGAEHWCLIGQQVMLGQLSDVAEGCVSRPDQWDGYAASRDRLLSAIRDGGIDNVVILTGDAHSSWAMDIAEDPFDPAAYQPATGAGSLAVEFVAPGISSPPEGGDPAELMATHPHLKMVETTRQGYVLVDVTVAQVQAEWYFVDTVRERSDVEQLGAALRTLDGENHLTLATTSTTSPPAPPPAP